MRTNNKSLKYNILCAILTGLVLCGCMSSSKSTSTAVTKSDKQILPDPAKVKTGNTFSFGRYEQDNDPENGAEPIEWQVLAIKDGKALAISRYALDAKPFNDSYINVTWKRSTVRKWLNGEFYNSAFNSSEKAVITNIKNSNLSNRFSGSRGGFSTNDRIFLLSFDEANQYFSDDISRQCEATAYTKAKGAYVSSQGNSWWWLRSPGRKGSDSAVVLDIGYVSGVGYAVNDGANVLRPAFWLNL